MLSFVGLNAESAPDTGRGAGWGGLGRGEREVPAPIPMTMGDDEALGERERTLPPPRSLYIVRRINEASGETFASVVIVLAGAFALFRCRNVQVCRGPNRFNPACSPCCTWRWCST